MIKRVKVRDFEREREKRSYERQKYCKRNRDFKRKYEIIGIMKK